MRPGAESRRDHAEFFARIGTMNLLLIHRGKGTDRTRTKACSPRAYVSTATVGMARRAVPARVVAGGTNSRATLAIAGVAPLHAARTSQRDVPTTLNRFPPGRGRGWVGSRGTGVTLGHDEFQIGNGNRNQAAPSCCLRRMMGLDSPSTAGRVMV